MLGKLNRFSSRNRCTILSYTFLTTALVASANTIAISRAYASTAFSGSNNYNGQLILNFTNLTTQTLTTSGIQGWWSPQAGHFANNPNYITGYYAGTNYYNNFFTFNTVGLSSLVVQSATLKLNGYSIDGSYTYKLSDVTTSFATLTSSSPNTAVATQVYNDLYTGVSYGSFGINASQSNTLISFALNSNAISAINNMILGAGYFMLGGSINTPPSSDINNTQPFFLASNLGGSVNPVFDGGTLRMDQSNVTYMQNFTVSNAVTNTIMLISTET